MKKLDMIWAMLKIYLNNPNYFVKQNDVLSEIYMEGEKDVNRISAIHSESFLKED